jgi:hypothetical protein
MERHPFQQGASPSFSQNLLKKGLHGRNVCAIFAPHKAAFVGTPIDRLHLPTNKGRCASFVGKGLAPSACWAHRCTPPQKLKKTHNKNRFSFLK